MCCIRGDEVNYRSSTTDLGLETENELIGVDRPPHPPQSSPGLAQLPSLPELRIIETLDSRRLYVEPQNNENVGSPKPDV